MSMIGCLAALPTAAMKRLKAHPGAVDEYLHPNDGEGVPPFYVEIDKAWHAIHYMLSGSAAEGIGPAFQAVLGGVAVGEDVGYGPARILTPAEVRAVADLLEPLAPDVFAKRYQPEAMDAAEVYPEIWVRDGAEGLDYILDNYQQMRTFYLDARERGDGAILWLS